MIIGILQAGHFPDALRPVTGDYPEIFERFLSGQGLELEHYAVVDLDFPADVHQCDGWLITGSRHGAYDDMPFIHPLENFVRDAFAAEVPLVGICFGHQIIAQALGGQVDKFDQGWAVGRQDYDWQGETLSLNAWHQDQVVAVPPGATRIASNDFCENAALVYGKQALTVQPHPEFGSDIVALLAENRAPGIFPDDRIAAATAQLDEPNDNLRLAKCIAQFFKERTVQ